MILAQWMRVGVSIYGRLGCRFLARSKGVAKPQLDRMRMGRCLSLRIAGEKTQRQGYFPFFCPDQAWP